MAYTATIKPNGGTEKWKAQPSLTSLRGLVDGTAPYLDDKGQKAAWVEVTFTSGDVYTQGGVALNLLGSLVGWTRIDAVLPCVYYNANATAAWEVATPFAQNDATVANRLMILSVLIGGAQAAASRVLTGVTLKFLVIGV